MKRDRKSSTWRGRERSWSGLGLFRASSAASRPTMLGRREMTSGSSSGSSAAIIESQTMLTTFHGIECQGLGFLRLRGEKRRSSRRHAMHEQRNQELGVQPSQDRVVAVVRESVEVTERLPSLEGQLPF